MKRKISILLVLVMLLGTFAACGKTDEGGKTGKEGSKKKIALLTETAGTQVFLLDMINSLKDNQEKYGYEAIISECPDNAAFENNCRSLVQEGVDLIIGGGWKAGEAINKVATEFPDKTNYAIIDSVLEAENVKCITYREQEGAYLVGILAAMVMDDDKNVIGSVNVSQGEGSWKWRWGLMEGAKTVKKDAKFLFNYTGDYNEPAKAKEFAIQQFEQGAQFINAACAGGDKGVFEAAKEKGFYTSGQDIDLTTPDNPNIVSCQLKDTYATTEYLVKQFMEKWTTDNEEWGLAEGAIGVVHITHKSKNPITDRLSEDELKKLKQTAEDIKSGKLNLNNMPKEEEYGK